MIEFVHLSCLSLEIILLPEYVPKFLTIALTCVHLALVTQGMLFQLGLVSTYFPVRCQVSRFDGKVVSLLRSPCFLKWDDLDQQLIAALLIQETIQNRVLARPQFLFSMAFYL